MAQKPDKDLSLTLRGTGLRKKAARALAEASGSGNTDKTPMVTRTVESLRGGSR